MHGVHATANTALPKAQSVFDAMIAAFKSGDENLKPNVVTYGALIDAWAKAGEPERAESILREMDSEKTLAVKPNVITYGSAMNGWSRSGRPERVQALYDEMLQKHQAGEADLRPNSFTYDILISAWLKSQQPDAVSNAQRVFDDMMASYRSGQKDLKPWIDKFCALIAKARSNSR